MRTSVLALAFAVALFATSCDSFDIFVAATTGEGTVYECSAPDGSTVEVCYLDDAGEELGKMLGRTCGDPSRRWPWFTNKLNVGCAYKCPPIHNGCNAENGCYCPR